MKRTLTAIAFVAVLAGAAAAQSSSPRNDESTNTTTPTTTTTQPNTIESNTTPPATTTTTTTSDMNGSGTTDLPRTASPLPLAGAGGLLSLGTGLWLSRRRR